MPKQKEIKLSFSDDYKEPKTSNSDLIEYVDTLPRINPAVSTTIIDRFRLKESGNFIICS